MIQSTGLPFPTVDPKYEHFFKLVGLLVKLDVISIAGHSKHSFSVASTLFGLNQMPKPKGHWIPMAVVSLSMDYMEVHFGPGKRRSL